MPGPDDELRTLLRVLAVPPKPPPQPRLDRIRALGRTRLRRRRATLAGVCASVVLIAATGLLIGYDQRLSGKDPAVAGSERPATPEPSGQTSAGGAAVSASDLLFMVPAADRRSVYAAVMARDRASLLAERHGCDSLLTGGARLVGGVWQVVVSVQRRRPQPCTDDRWTTQTVEVRLPSDYRREPVVDFTSGDRLL